jgi:predicted dehydrogenase
VIRVGIIGCGGVALAHARAIAEFPSRAKLVAVADIDANQLRQFAQQFEVQAHERAEDLLAQSDVGCVLIALPHDLHAGMAVQAANAGKDILLEKPMAVSLVECDEIMAAVAANAVTLSVGQSYRYSDGPWRAKQILDRGEVGSLVFAVGTFSKNWDVDRRRGWHLDRSRGGGMWLTNGVHTVNTLLWMAGSPVVAVKGTSGQRLHPRDIYPQMDSDDATLALLHHQNGVYTVAAVTGYRRGARKGMLELTCTEGKIRCEPDRIWVGVDEQWDERPLVVVHNKVREWDEFLSCLETASDPPVPGAEARHTMEILLAVEESSATGREVRLDASL